MREFDLLIPTAGSLAALGPLLKSIVSQDVLPVRLVLLVRKEHTVKELGEFSDSVHELLDNLIPDVVILHAHYSDHTSGKGVGYDRHFLVQQAAHEFSCMIDEDNVLPAHFFRDLTASYREVIAALGHETIISPTIMRHGQIQSQGITRFSYLFPKYTFGRLGDQPRQIVKMLGANSLFGPTKLFQQIQFDPRFEGNYEDVDFTYRVGTAGYSVVVLRDVVIHHEEKQKSLLEDLFLGSSRSAYLRSRNRIRFVRKNANFRQQIAYFSIGLRLQTALRTWYILRFGGKQKGALLRAIRKGIWAGILSR